MKGTPVEPVTVARNSSDLTGVLNGDSFDLVVAIRETGRTVGLFGADHGGRYLAP